ncbi:MAG: CvpA family protein [Bacteroidales bacterium]|nr:CvpA family protein [Candidatus Physcousia equi]
MLDIIIVALLAVGFFSGWKDGLVKSLCSFAGFFLGLLVAYTFYIMLGEKIAPHLGQNAQAAPIVAFLLLWIAVPIALNFAGSVLTKCLNALCMGSLNTLGGAAIGVVKYFLGATLVLYVLVMMNIVSSELVDHSFFGDKMLRLADTIMAHFREKPITL